MPVDSSDLAPRDRGQAHRRRVGVAIREMLAELDGLGPDALRQARRQKYLDMGSRSLAG